MDDLFEFIFEFVFEIGFNVFKNKEIAWPFRLLALLMIIVVYGFLIVVLGYLTVESWKNRSILGIILTTIGYFVVLGLLLYGIVASGDEDD